MSCILPISFRDLFFLTSTIAFYSNISDRFPHIIIPISCALSRPAVFALVSFCYGTAAATGAAVYPDKYAFIKIHYSAAVVFFITADSAIVLGKSRGKRIVLELANSRRFQNHHGQFHRGKSLKVLYFRRPDVFNRAPNFHCTYVSVFPPSGSK